MANEHEETPLEVITISAQGHWGTINAVPQWQPTPILRHAKLSNSVEGSGKERISTYKVVIQQKWYDSVSRKEEWRELPFIDLSHEPSSGE